MQIEQEGGLGNDVLSGSGVGGVAALVAGLLSGVALWWSRRQNKGRIDADHAADVARARFDEASATTATAVLELLRQQLLTQQAEINDLKVRQEEQRERTAAAQSEVLGLRGELATMQQELRVSEHKRAEAEARVQELTARVGQLEEELRKNGIEVPR